MKLKDLVLAEGSDHNEFNEEKDVFKPTRRMLKKIYGKKYWRERTNHPVDAPLEYKLIPQLEEELKPATGGLWTSLFASSAAIVEVL